MTPILWPVLFAAVLAVDALVWRRYGDGATVSGWLQAWAAGSVYHAVWFAVAWAWFGAHVLAGADAWALAVGLASGTMLVYAWRQIRRVEV